MKIVDNFAPLMTLRIINIAKFQMRLRIFQVVKDQLLGLKTLVIFNRDLRSRWFYQLLPVSITRLSHSPSTSPISL
jgi:hypothetical protein